MAEGQRRSVGKFLDEEILERLRLHGFTFLRDGLVIAGAYILAEAVRFDGPIPDDNVRLLLSFLPLILFVHLFFNWLFGIHRRLWQYVGLRDVRAQMHAIALAVITIGVVDLAFQVERPVPVAVIPIGGALALLGLTAARLWRELVRVGLPHRDDWDRVLIVGAGQGGRVAVTDLLGNPDWRQDPVGFLDDDPRKSKMRIHGIPVLGAIEELPEIVADYKIDIVAVAIPSASTAQLDRILALAQETGARIQILPSHAEVMSGKEPGRLRDLNLDDLLDREPGAVLEDPIVQELIAERTVLVTGARGSIGFELCRQALRLNPVAVLALDNNETGLFYLQRELRNEPNAALLKPILADVSDYPKLSQVFQRFRPDIVFHAAAYKHVPMLEAYPEEAVVVNVIGTQNLCRLASEHGCERFVFVSTDKAVDPVNVLGFSKRLGELIVRAYSMTQTAFCAVRFGNVVGSRGSALPEFVKQIDAGGPVTITDPEVERYFMTISEAVSLVIRAGAEAKGGELFMLDMGEPIKIADLAKRIIRLRGLRVGKDIEVNYTGLRPGEKLTEELTFSAERTTPTTNSSIFVVHDSSHPNLFELEQTVNALARSANLEDGATLHAMLAKAARGERLAAKERLTSAG